MLEEQFITIDSRDIETNSVRGKNDEMSFILLHEGLGCTKLWGSFPRRLSEIFGGCVFSYSRFGYGSSSAAVLPKPLDYHTEEATQYLPEILDIANLGNCILIGHSDGASIALIYAALISDPRIKGVVVLAPHVKAEKKTVAQIRQVFDQCKSSGLYQKLLKYHGDNTDCAFYGWSRCWLDPAFARWSIEHILPQIRVPVLAVRGSDDPYNSSYHVNSIRDKVQSPVCTVSILGCRHSPHRESLSSLTSVLEMFLSRFLT